MKSTIFIPNRGLRLLRSSNNVLFLEGYIEEDADLIQPIILTVLIVSKNCIDKIVMSLEQRIVLKDLVHSSTS